ncbi:hypothetical protein CHLNCDRAFT_140709 [Chlorella variabilis]|uniref:Exportin-1/Importin-beta-like domain-containing protein n=1 Tax=Chlorella variabilis TaxID=554065 RepID=E1Z612_CHLVA|nr:hypothetical protein CHLNCDRAFT_140709 [Chlorella variabilis]EFN58851.1 hypothetical protein CHLNCDRAFT_140709 [Chlorella variabilis]|eukprot:XP_005850953.1 hypothetical protein CHLNCDRAFT_140709 [Chlorella variabilis]
MQGAVELRSALQALYCSTDSEERHAADLWLRGFSAQDGAWQLLAELLADPAGAQHVSARFFAATSLRHCCQRQPGVVQPAALASLAPLLVQQLAAAAAAGCWHTRNQLAAALATVAVRAPAWPEAEVLPQLMALAQGALQGSGSGGGEWQQLALLRLLSALAEAACSKDVGMHPQRRAALTAALAAASQPLDTVKQALAPGSTPAVQVAALQLLQAWCALGQPPAGAEDSTALWQQLHAAALHPEMGGPAAEALAALYAACQAGYSGAASDSPQLARRRHQLLGVLLSLLPGWAAELQQALAQAQQPHQQARLLFAALTVLGAAARAADSQAGTLPAPAAAAAAEAVHLAAEVALASLQHPQLEVTLAALQLWDEQLERWKGSGAAASGAAHSGAAAGACTLQQRSALLAQLCGALLQRMALPADLPAAVCTADARDLPDGVQKLQVRREVGDTFRAAADCLGPRQTRQQLLQLAGEAAVAGAPLQQECCLYAANLIWGRQRSPEAHEAAEEVRQAAAAVAAALRPATPKLAGTALTLLGGMAEQLPALVQREAVVKGPNGRQQGSGLLARLLEVLLQLVQLPSDEKLSRNAATCCYRLTGSRQLAAALAAQHPGWGEALCGCFAAAGGMHQRPQEGEDLSTAQFLLVTICRLSAAAAGEAGGAPHSQQCAALLRQLLGQMAAAADAALDAAAAAPPGGAQHQRQLEQAALQVESIAVAIEAVANSCSSAAQGDRGGAAGLQYLPVLLTSIERVLRRVAAAGCAAQQVPDPGRGQPRQPQQHLLHHLAAAVAPTPAAGTGLDLLHPLVAAPQHPCVLQTLAQLASSRLGGGSSSSGSGPSQQLQAAARSSLQAAAVEHGSDPDWQPAILALGESCVRWLPAVAADGATLDALLCTAQHSMRSFHREACERAVQFAEALCCVGCPPRHSRADGASAAPSPPHATQPPAAAAAAAAAAHQHLRRCLDAGLGSQLVLGLLLAASGTMPAYMMAPVAEVLHRTWQAVGTDRFDAWLREAALQLAGGGEAPWRRWKAEAQAAALRELLAEPCLHDARRFKRLLKVFCGGKKKGRVGDPPARGGG